MAFCIAILIKKKNQCSISSHVWTFGDCLNRWVLEASGTLEPRRSALEDDFEEEEEDKEEEQPMEIDEPNGREKVRTFIISLCSDLIKFIKIICCFSSFFPG